MAPSGSEVLATDGAWADPRARATPLGVGMAVARVSHEPGGPPSLHSAAAAHRILWDRFQAAYRQQVTLWEAVALVRAAHGVPDLAEAGPQEVVRHHLGVPAPGRAHGVVKGDDRPTAVHRLGREHHHAALRHPLCPVRAHARHPAPPAAAPSGTSAVRNRAPAARTPGGKRAVVPPEWGAPATRPCGVVLPASRAAAQRELAVATEHASANAPR